MTTTFSKSETNHLLSVFFALVLTVSVVLMNLYGLNVDNISNFSLPDSVSTTLIGGDVGGCGIVVGAVGMLAALAIAGVTVGIGGALVISATIHVGAILCAS